MENVKLNSEICAEHVAVLMDSNVQWFNGYHFSTEDYLKLVKAVKFFEDIKQQQRKKLIKEGLL